MARTHGRRVIGFNLYFGRIKTCFLDNFSEFHFRELPRIAATCDEKVCYAKTRFRLTMCKSGWRFLVAAQDVR